ncbi:transporter substrate-binding domain-containing protein [Duganella sp. FT135W]|uniref:Transporter substrate-binding domain-containing protein n=1 Tax=Duganella flavida TaxID=2692175 RepID=A0A6L8K9A3_9BURK|nr:transporter substrate-binding domain-containing protein [Duganella flavida]MYM23197.1 transporter substrate-binding domain-containing protein [Duganella flavida]
MLILFYALSAGAVAAEPAPLKLVVGDMAPYSMAAGPAGPGSLVEITQALGQRMGTPVDVQFYPWPRALAMVSLAPRTLILPLTRNDERENKYRWLLKLYRQKLIFVGLHDNHNLSDPALLRSARLTVLRGTPHKRLLLDAGYTNVSECATIRECIRMVKKGIADASFGAEDTHRSAASMDGNKATEFSYSPAFRQNDVWLAGSLDFTEEDTRKWRATMDGLRADGTVARILHKYGATGN